MDSRELARLLVKIFGLLLVVYVVGQIPAMALTFAMTLWVVQSSQLLTGASLVLAADLMTLIVGLSIIRFAGPIVNRYILNDPSDVTSDAGLSGIEDVAVAVLGFLFFALGLSGAVGQTIRNIYLPNDHFAWSEFWEKQIYLGGEAWMRMLLGIVFMLRSRSLVAWRRGAVALRPMARDRDTPP